MTEESTIECLPEPKCWQVGLSLLGRFESLLNNELMSDVCFLISDAESVDEFPEDTLMVETHRFHGHKMILATSSPVFEKMFAETIGQYEQIEVNDIETAAFVVMLRFAYCNEILLNDKCLLSTLHAANVYQYPILLEAVVKRLLTTLDPEDALQLYEKLHQYEIPSLNDQLTYFIRSTALKLISSKSFTEIQLSTLQFLFSLPSLNVPEATFFNRCLDWARAECDRQYLDQSDSDNLKSVLGDLIYKIRIDDCDFRIFLNLLDQFFSKDETLDILTYLQLPDHPKNGVMELFDCGNRRPWTYTHFLIPMSAMNIVGKPNPVQSFVELEFDVASMLIIQFKHVGHCSLIKHCEEMTVSSGSTILSSTKNPKFTALTNQTFQCSFNQLLFKPNQKYRFKFQWNCVCDRFNDSVTQTRSCQKLIFGQNDKKAKMLYSYRNFPQCISQLSFFV